MTEDNLPDGAAPQEEELNIDGASEPVVNPDAPDTSINKMAAHPANVQIGKPGASTEEFIDELLQTPEDQLIPWEECYIPSRGIYYGWPEGVVMVKAMGQAAEKILATQRLAQSGQSIDYLFRACCQFPDGFDPSNLLLGDRVFLLYFLRGITYGNIYEFAVTCPDTNCQAVNTHKYDLNELASTIVWANNSLGSEPFRVDLPYLSKTTGREVWVGVRFLRAVDANDMIAKRKARKKMFARPGGARSRMTPRQNQRNRQQEQQQLDDTISENMEKIIISVMGVQDPFTIRSFISKMHSQDTTAVREWLRENTPGIDNTILVECPDCNTEFTTELPITESFFRPAKSG
jgi:hypothetical protein